MLAVQKRYCDAVVGSAIMMNANTHVIPCQQKSVIFEFEHKFAEYESQGIVDTQQTHREHEKHGGSLQGRPDTDCALDSPDHLGIEHNVDSKDCRQRSKNGVDGQRSRLDPTVLKKKGGKILKD